MENIKAFGKLILQHWQTALIGGLAVVCVIIVIMGMLKKFCFNKIKSKLLRKIALAFSSIVMVFPATALYFLSSSIDFKYYFYSCLALIVATIVIYWFYENTGLRNVINLIGKKTIENFAAVVATSFSQNTNNEETKEMLVDTAEKTKNEVKVEIDKTIEKATNNGEFSKFIEHATKNDDLSNL